MPQSSILGPLLFNIDIIDLFYEFEESNIASYADDTTPYSCARDTQTVISELKSLTNFFAGFQYNHLKANPGKCYLLCYQLCYQLCYLQCYQLQKLLRFHQFH